MKIFTEILQKISSSKESKLKHQDFDLFHDEMMLSTCILLLEVSKSDDSYDDIERDKIITILAKKFKLDDKQTAILIQLADQKNQEMISLYDWTSIINEKYSYESKKELIKLLWDVAYADGRIDKYEDYTIRKISELIYVRHSDFIKAKIR